LQTKQPDYFPPVQLTPNGLYVKAPLDEEYLKKHPDAVNDPDHLIIVPGVPIKQANLL
jgi:hypothetical protein